LETQGGVKVRRCTASDGCLPKSQVGPAIAQGTGVGDRMDPTKSFSYPSHRAQAAHEVEKGQEKQQG
jgi:hypothetical protein